MAADQLIQGGSSPLLSLSCESSCVCVCVVVVGGLFFWVSCVCEILIRRPTRNHDSLSLSLLCVCVCVRERFLLLLCVCVCVCVCVCEEIGRE